MKDNTAQSTNLETLIERLAIGGRNQFADCFDNFLNLALSYFCNNMDERQMELRKKEKEDEKFRNDFVDALKAYGDLAEDYHDPLGDIFMKRISHGEKGQFFTPEDVSLLMAEIVGVGDRESVNDPACGTGRTLLMALKTARAKGNEPLLYANDLSLTCAKMTLLNFCVNSVGGEVSCGNALTLDYDNFTFFKIDKIRGIVDGRVISTYWQYTLANVKEVEKKRQDWWLWIAQRGWIQYHHVKSMVGTGQQEEDSDVKVISRDKKWVHAQVQYDPLPTEVKVDKTGQISMF